MILVDTYLLLWSAADSTRLSPVARNKILDAKDARWFSAVSIWEVAIKRARHKHFRVDASDLRRGLLANDWLELPVSGAHALAVLDLPPLHADPFDRMLLAQARVEGLTLLTSDKVVARYPGEVQRV